MPAEPSPPSEMMMPVLPLEPAGACPESRTPLTVPAGVMLLVRPLTKTLVFPVAVTPTPFDRTHALCSTKCSQKKS